MDLTTVMHLRKPVHMLRSLTLLLAVLSSALLSAQTYFYIDQIVVQPAYPTVEDDINIDLIGGLSSTGAYIVSAGAQVTGSLVNISITAADPGGLDVIVPHSETVHVGQLPEGTYTIVFNAVNVGDFAPSPQHQFVVSAGGSPCDHLLIGSVQWHAFTDTAIIVHAMNTNMVSELFDYPNFILFDVNGDTLAKETVNFFGIGEDSWHILRVMNDAVIPPGPFPGVLELWTGFTTTLACSWELPVHLCPPEPCATLIPMVQNLGGALAIGTYNWFIADAGEVMASGQFEMTEAQQMDMDTICLAPGAYEMSVLPNQEPTGGFPVFGVVTEGWISGPSQPVFGPPPTTMPFDFYLTCAEGTNGISGIDLAHGIVVSQESGTLLLRRLNGAALGAIEVFDAQGRSILRAASLSSTAVLRTDGFASGMVIIRAANTTLRTALVSY